MKKFMNFSILLSIILLLNCTFAKKKSESNGLSKSDDYYIVFLNNTLDVETGSKRKRSEEKEEIISTTIEEIHSLIMKNKSTYKDIEKFEKIETQDDTLNNLVKRDENSDNNYVYELASVNERTALYAYLSPKLVKKITSLPNVITCLPRREFKLTGSRYYSNSQIKAETKWKSVRVKENAPIHLSLISQGKFNEELVNKYDRNYYYPKTAGKNVDIFMFDAGFNFTYKDFPKSKDRQVRCEVIINNGKTYRSLSKDVCYYLDYEDHGSQTAAVASGVYHGVADKANLHGIVLATDDKKIFWENLISGLNYVRDNLITPHKAVINFSFGNFIDMDDLESEDIKMLQELLTEISEMGTVIVASAGNDGRPVYDEEMFKQVFIPCTLKDVICVGGIFNNMEDGFSITIGNEHVKLHDDMVTSQYSREFMSNYGKGVDLYAPFWIHYNGPMLVNNDYYNLFMDMDAEIKNPVVYDNDYVFIPEIDMINGGTSFSAPIVAGVAATIMSENPTVEFNSKTMLDYLLKTGEKDIIEGIEESHVFINNGKHTVYSSDKVYRGCGTYSGNKKCKHNKCCTAAGQCVSMKEDSCKVSEGCQSEFGPCN